MATTRNRTKGSLIFKQGKYFHTTAYPNGTPAWGGYQGMLGQMADVVVGKPGWREIARQTRRPVINPMRSSTGTIEYNPTSLYRAHDTTSPTIFGWHDWLKGEVMGLPQGYAGLSGTPELFSSQELEALAVESRTKCLAEVGVSLNNWEAMAEWRQTRDMVFGPIGRWNRWLSRFTAQRRYSVGRFGLVRGSLHRIGALPRNRRSRDRLSPTLPGDVWLIWRYGVSPLISGVMEVLQNLSRISIDRGWEKTSAVRELKARRTTTYSWEPDGKHHARTSIIREETYRHRSISYDRMTWNISDELGLQGKTLLTTPWELVPWSFVVDWFVNAGDYLGAQVQKSFYPDALGQCEVTEFEAKETRTTTSMWGTGILVIDSPGLGTVTSTALIKTRGVGLGNIGLVVRPGWADPWKRFLGDDLARKHDDRVYDSLALVGQQVGALVKAAMSRR